MKQEDIYYYNPRCFMSSGFMLDDIIMNLFLDITKQTTDSVKKDLFSKIPDGITYLYKVSLQDYSRKIIVDTKKTLRSHLLVTDKLIMYLDGLHNSNSPRQIDHPKCTILENYTVFYIIFHNYFQESLLQYVICENCSSGSYESIKSTFPMSVYLKEPPSFLKILFQRGTYDMTTGKAIKNELKVTIPLECLCKKT